MKKVLVFGLICTLCLTGCGEKESTSANDKKEEAKKLTCTMTENEDGMSGGKKSCLYF